MEQLTKDLLTSIFLSSTWNAALKYNGLRVDSVHNPTIGNVPDLFSTNQAPPSNVWNIVINLSMLESNPNSCSTTPYCKAALIQIAYYSFLAELYNNLWRQGMSSKDTLHIIVDLDGVELSFIN